MKPEPSPFPHEHDYDLNPVQIHGTTQPFSEADLALHRVRLKEPQKQRAALEMENLVLADQLRSARDRNIGLRWQVVLLGAAVLFLGFTHPARWVLWTVAVFMLVAFAAVVAGGFLFAAKRGDEAMGIGDTQGR